MKALAPLIGIIFLIALAIKYWWIVLIAAIVIGVGYLIVKTAAPPKTAGKTPVGKPPRRAAAVPVSPLRHALLTRQTTPNPASNNTFTAIDLETTGLDADTDGIVEVGLVKFTGDGTVLDEFSTLVNTPGSSREARDGHHIDDKDLIGAPSINQVLPEVLAFISGTILVGHNLDFEGKFLAAAARRARIPLSAGVALCTLRTCRRQLEGRAFSLTAMYKTATGELGREQTHGTRRCPLPPRGSPMAAPRMPTPSLPDRATNESCRCYHPRHMPDQLSARPAHEGIRRRAAGVVPPIPDSA